MFVTWFWVMTPNLQNRPAPVPLSATSAKSHEEGNRCVNPVFSGVLDDMTASIAVHLDDTHDSIRAAVARVILRIARIDSEVVRRQLMQAKERHRSPQLCESLLESLAWQL